MTAHLYATDDTAEDALKWVDLQGRAITIEALRASLTNNDGDVDEAGVELARAFSRKLYLILSDTCKGEPYRMVESAGFGQCFEAWRILLRRYASKTPGTKRALLQPTQLSRSNSCCSTWKKCSADTMAWRKTKCQKISGAPSW